jgi:hypothetical protein
MINIVESQEIDSSASNSEDEQPKSSPVLKMTK